ncbi:conserved phage C-terminal domain-containing protein [Veillonella denticariosi]|uniref:conserved phage C-terminal domain-containing protein n=1 Tax=Veillonella denticariosi TaxID=419208 RepID=UPI002492D16A|nr:conserved phage C-terminal domain-containing protein [Veillonella denticariosi]
MAERRMMSKSIIKSDTFLDMPATTQNLYFHMLLDADDDGFINAPKSIMRMIGAKEDDMKVLTAKQFVIPFESGVVVIKDWKIHNYIQNDRYKPSALPERDLINIQKDKSYTLKVDVSDMDTKCIQDVSIGKDRIGKVRLGKDRIGKDSIDILCHVSHDDVDKPYIEIIEYLNMKTGSKFKPTTKPYIQAIRSRLKEGYTVDDFKTVIDKKCREWKGTKLEKYLTPKTLFAPSHFDTYLNSNEIAAMTDTERKVAELNALIDAVEGGTHDTGNIESYGPTIDISEF